MVWIRGRLNRLGSLGIKAATLASAGEGIDQSTTHLWLSAKDLHPDAEEACCLSEMNHHFSHSCIIWLQSKQLFGTIGLQPGKHSLLDAIQSNQAAVGVSDS